MSVSKTVRGGSSPSGDAKFGLVVKWDNGGFASLNWEFDSPSVHQNLADDVSVLLYK